MKIQDQLPHLNTTDTATVIMVASESVRQCCGFANAYFNLGVYIKSLDDCGYIADEVEDIRNEIELSNLIISAGFRLQQLLKEGN